MTICYAMNVILLPDNKCGNHHASVTIVMNYSITQRQTVGTLKAG